MDDARARTLAGVGGISASILLSQLALTRILSVTTWYHFAFLAISLALLGLGAGGVFLHLTPRLHRVEFLYQRLVTYAIAFSLSVGLLAVVLLWTPLSYLAFQQGLAALVTLLFLGAAPFFFGGICLGLVISRLHEDVGRVYAADLIGAAMGCLLFVPLMSLVGGGGVLMIGALLGLAAALGFGWGIRGRYRLAPLLLAGLLTTVVGAQVSTGFFDVRYPKTTVRVPSPLFAEWNMLSRVTVNPAESSDLVGLGGTCGQSPVEALDVASDSSAGTPILIADGVEQVDYLKCALTAMGYVVATREPRSLVIGPGGGRDVWTALTFGASEVIGVEINGLIAEDVLSEFHQETSGLYSRDDVTLHVADGRSFIRGSEDAYDVIQASLVDTWAATSAGAFALSENTLYTVEALLDYIRHLTPDGVLTLSRWEGTEMLRLISVARAAGGELGWPGIGDRLFVAASRETAVAGGNLANLVLKRRPFTDAELKSLTAFAVDNDFEVLYSPEGGLPEYRAVVSTPEPESYVASLPMDISPVTDDRPFFFQTSRIPDFNTFLERVLAPGLQDGLYVVIRLMVITTLMVVLFLVGPLWLGNHDRDRDRPLPGGILGYFGLLGAGFMLLEIGLMQRFVLFLGHPSYSLTVVLFTLLLGAGLGSRISRRVSHRLLAPVACAAAAAVGITYAFILPTVFDWALGWSIQTRIALAGVLLLPLGLALGIPFPTGIRAVGARRPEVLAWSWAINGATSVLGSVLAVLLAITSGFRVVTLVGAGIYLVAMFATRNIESHLIDDRGMGALETRVVAPLSAGPHQAT